MFVWVYKGCWIPRLFSITSSPSITTFRTSSSIIKLFWYQTSLIFTYPQHSLVHLRLRRSSTSSTIPLSTPSPLPLEHHLPQHGIIISKHDPSTHQPYTIAPRTAAATKPSHTIKCGSSTPHLCTITEPCAQAQSSNRQRHLQAQQTPPKHRQQVELRPTVARRAAKGPRRTPNTARRARRGNRTI